MGKLFLNLRRRTTESVLLS